MKKQFFHRITWKFAAMVLQSYSTSEWNLMVIEKLNFTALPPKTFTDRKIVILTKVDGLIFLGNLFLYNVNQKENKLTVT